VAEAGDAEPTAHLDFHNEALVLRIVSWLAVHSLAGLMTTHRPDHAWSYGIDVRIVAGVDAQTGSQMCACIPALPSVHQEPETGVSV